MQKDPFVLFKEAYCKKKTVKKEKVKAEQHFLFFWGGGQFFKKYSRALVHTFHQFFY